MSNLSISERFVKTAKVLFIKICIGIFDENIEHVIAVLGNSETYEFIKTIQP
jgi:hypothetical protein